MLKVKFIRCGNAVMVEILEQGPEIKRGDFYLESDDGHWTIVSHFTSSLRHRELSIKGKLEMSGDILAYSYLSEWAAKEAVDAFVKLIIKHNKQHNNFTRVIREVTQGIEITIVE